MPYFGALKQAATFIGPAIENQKGEGD